MEGGIGQVSDRFFAVKSTLLAVRDAMGGLNLINNGQITLISSGRMGNCEVKERKPGKRLEKERESYRLE